MTAGKGIVHEEMPVPEHLETGGPIEGVQLWINLPRASKGLSPGYQDLQPEQLPWEPIRGGRLRAFAGEWLGKAGPVRTPAAIAYAHLELDPGGKFEQVLPLEWSAAAAVLHGTVRTGGKLLEAGQIGLFERDGEGYAIESETGGSVMLLAGLPLGEPIAHYGPFVMNTAEEIQAAVLEYQHGALGHLEPR